MCQSFARQLIVGVLLHGEALAISATLEHHHFLIRATAKNCTWRGGGKRAWMGTSESSAFSTRKESSAFIMFRGTPAPWNQVILDGRRLRINFEAFVKDRGTAASRIDKPLPGLLTVLLERRRAVSQHAKDFMRVSGCMHARGLSNLAATRGLLAPLSARRYDARNHGS
jgi:hypothetical protein